MKTKISALIDGELDEREMRDVCASMRHDDELRRVYGAYALIGDALRREPHLTTEISAAVLDKLTSEPVVLAPGAMVATQPQRQSWVRPALALAATVAGVAVVAWLGLAAGSAQKSQELAQTATEKLTQKVAQKLTQLSAPAHPLVVAVSEDPDLQEYLIAHQIHSGSIYLNGETQHIRTVSLSEAESR